MELSCPLGTTRRVPEEKFPRKPVRSRWLGIDLVLFFFCEFMDLDSVSVHKHAKKQLGQYPAILTSHLVNQVTLCLQKSLQTLLISFWTFLRFSPVVGLNFLDSPEKLQLNISLLSGRKCFSKKPKGVKINILTGYPL